ncbi:hypothetical protein LP414_27625 [Polaromonas sp. P1(28)-13]|nr:hypothetical protein LP414_27625 [Polaromonas sp. P1(28)-13]
MPLSLAAVQSQANPLSSRMPSPRQVRDLHSRRVNIAASLDPFEDMQEAAELELLRHAGRRAGRSFESDRTFGY